MAPLAGICCADKVATAPSMHLHLVHADTLLFNVSVTHGALCCKRQVKQESVLSGAS